MTCGLPWPLRPADRPLHALTRRLPPVPHAFTGARDGGGVHLRPADGAERLRAAGHRASHAHPRRHPRHLCESGGALPVRDGVRRVPPSRATDGAPPSGWTPPARVLMHVHVCACLRRCATVLYELMDRPGESVGVLASAFIQVRAGAHTLSALIPAGAHTLHALIPPPALAARVRSHLLASAVHTSRSPPSSSSTPSTAATTSVPSRRSRAAASTWPASRSS